MPTPLIPQEIYLLERYSSLEYYGLARDAWEDMVKYVEACLERFVRQLPADYRSRPLPLQPDIVWGQRVLPNFRDTLQFMYDGYIKRSHEDWSCYRGFQGGINGDIRGQREFSFDWFDEVESGGIDKYTELLYKAGSYAGNIWPTSGAYWCISELSYDYDQDSRGALPLVSEWPKYRLNHEINVQTDTPVLQTGIYLPLVHGSCAQLLIVGEPATKANVGINPRNFQRLSHEPTLWTLVERVDGEAVADGLANLLEERSTSVLRVAAGHTAPKSGWWFTPASQGSRRYFKQDDVFPEIEGSSYGATFWQWSPDQSDPKL